MAGIWGPMTRLGLRSRFMNETQLYAGEYKDVKLLILPRNQRMLAGELQFMYDHVIPAGVHIYSDADLPNYQGNEFIININNFKRLLHSSST